MRRKFTYHYFVSNNEVTKKEFEQELQDLCMCCDTNYDNPLLNISYLDTKKFNKYMNSMKRGTKYLFCNDLLCNPSGGTRSRSMHINKNQHCCFCGKEITGYGNNPYPVCKDANARCCNECNDSVVIPARLKEAYKK